MDPPFRSIVAVGAVACAGLVGCGDDAASSASAGAGGGVAAAGGGSASPAREELEAYVQAERQAICVAYTSCCTEAERVHANALSALLFAGPEASTLDGCLASLDAFIPSKDLTDFLEAQLASGRATWDASKVEPCLAAWSDCAIPRVQRAGVWAEGCAEPPVVPARALGEACESFADCIDGTCEGGVCVALPQVGEACAPVNGLPLACGAGATCNTLESTCAALAAVGAPCTARASCATGECHAKPFETGVCSEPTICDGDTTNDADVVLGMCANSDPNLGSIACELGTSSVWRCTCDDGLGTPSTCEIPFDRAQSSEPDGVCANLGCCAS